VRSPETLQKQSAAHMGREQSEESKKKMRASRTRKPWSRTRRAAYEKKREAASNASAQ
jgi:hypothetical protein